MRNIRAFVGAGGLASAAAVAMGQPLQFNTVMSSSSPVPGAPGNGVLVDVSQVVLQDDGAVAAITKFNSAAPTIPTVTFNPTPGNLFTKIVAKKGDSLFGGAGGTFEEFWNLSSVNGNVTFIGEAQASANLGLFRYGYDAVTPTKIPIHIEGGEISGHASSLDTGSLTPTAYGVNGAGRLAFGAKTIPPSLSPNTQFVARWDGSGEPIRTVDGSSGLTTINEPSFSRTVLTESDTTVFIAHTTTGRGIYSIDFGGPTVAERVSAGFTIASDAYAPTRVVAASGTGAGGTTLFYASKNPSPSDESNQALMLLAGGTFEELGSYDFDPASGPAAIGFEPGAVMSANGSIAALVPDPDGGRAIFHDGTGSGSAQTIAEVGTNVGGAFEITVLSPSSGAPMVDDNGIVIFDAMIADASNVDIAALLAWGPDLDAPFVIIKAGDTVDVAGVPRTVLSILPNLPAPANVLGYDADVLKDGLNENNGLAFTIVYTDGVSAGVALLQTTVPEPSAILLTSLAAGIVLSRRRRISG